MSYYPYTDRFEVHRTIPDQPVPRSEVLGQLRQIAAEEDATWQSGKISGSYYCGDDQHYGHMTEVFGLFAHVNALQRDVCPSATKFTGEIIAMTLDLLGGAAISDTTPGGIVTSGGTGSILHALLAYRDHARQTRGVVSPNVIKPETAHAAFDKGSHLFGIDVRRVPVDPDTATVRPEVVADAIDENTVAIIGSACNYGYGTVDPIPELGALALERGVGLHVDGCLGGFILPWGRELGYDIPAFDFTVPGVTSISADTHKYGYGFKGSSVVLFRDHTVRNAQYFYLTDWSGGKYCSPGIDGSTSNGLLASTWASLLDYGKSGYRKVAAEIFSTAAAMQEAVRSHPELRIIGSPTFCFSFTSDQFDIYHVNDFMKLRGWRFNGQQYPNAIHMAVTGPQTRDGVVESFAADLAEAVEYANGKKGEPAGSAAIYGGVAGGMTDEADEFIKAVMADMMDHQAGVPPLE